MPTYQDAEKLMLDWVSADGLRKHMYGVAAAMRAYARKFKEDEEQWAMCGLLHDMDYEKYPEYDATVQTGHPYEGVKELRRRDYDEEIIQAILGHALYTGVPRQSLMAKSLFAVDELCGFLVACAWPRPDKFATLTVQSVKKKLKDKRFAAKVSRSDIELGLVELNIDKDEHIPFLIDVFREIQSDIFLEK
ncbi:MAG: HDIG domain-containing protein [Candidatus Komeilibacteria bacterium]|nr:HDIG domain-containing protein [Candidatus Komeilibacteria bacterium]